MGSWFSTNSNQVTEYDYAKYLDQVKRTDEDAAQLSKEATEKEQRTAKLIEEALDAQEKYRQKRKEESDWELHRIEEINNKIQANMLHASSIVCEIFFNLENGVCNDNRVEGKTSANLILDFYKRHLTDLEVFYMLCQLPILLPLIWPTGAGDEMFHDYKGVNKTNYVTMADGMLEGYMKGKLPGILKTASMHNQLRIPALDTTERSRLKTKCETYIKNAQTWKEVFKFVEETIKFLQDTPAYTDYYQWRLLRAKGKKGICDMPIKYLPSNWPLINPEYELKEAIMMAANVCFNRYGRCLDINGNTTSSKSDIILYGGRCFKINELMAKQAYEDCLRPRDDHTKIALWDQKSYIDLSTIVVNNKTNTVTYTSDTDNDLEQVTVGANNKKIWQYPNPTRKYTEILLKDQELEDGDETQYMSGINCDGVENLVNLLYDAAIKNKNYTDLNPYNKTNNNALLFCFDYLTVCPKLCEKYAEIDSKTGVYTPPLCTLVYTILVKNNAKWDITFPINTTMSCAQINTKIIGDNASNKIYSPLYMFSRTNMIDENESVTSNSDKSKSSSKAYTEYTFDIKTASNVGKISKTIITTDYNK